MLPRLSGSRLRRKILIVEDDEDTLDLYAQHFRQAGYVVETAAEGTEAITVALRVKPDVIVIDLGLPVLDGADTIAILRSYPTTMETPIIVCTDQRELLKKRTLNYSAVVEKPCDPSALEGAINEALGDTPESETG